MKANLCSAVLIAVTALCLALPALVFHAGGALAQPAASEQRSGSRPPHSGTEATLSGIGSRPSPDDTGMEATTAGSPREPGEVRSASEGVQASRIERFLRSVSDPNQSESNDVHFLVLAVAIYLVCLLVVEHLRAAGTGDDGRARGRGRRSDRAGGDGGQPG